MRTTAVTTGRAADGAASPEVGPEEKQAPTWLTVLLTVTGVFLALAIGWLSFAVLPALLYPAVPGMEMAVEDLDDGVRAEIEIARLGYQAETRIAVTQLLVGITGLSAALLAWQQFQRTKEKEREEARLALGQLQLTQKKEQVAAEMALRQGNLTLLGNAMEMLSNESSAVRIGGLHSLDSLARQSGEHRRACAQALSAYIREERGSAKLSRRDPDWEARLRAAISAKAESRPTTGRDPAADETALCEWGRNSGGLPADVETALSLLMGLVADWPTQVGALNLSMANLCLANFEGVDLEGADLTGSDVRGAYFHDVGLRRARIVGTDLRNTVLVRVALDECVCGPRTQVGAAQLWRVTRAGARNDGQVKWPADLWDGPGEHDGGTGVLSASTTGGGTAT